MGQAFGTPKAATTMDINTQIEMLEHNASIAGLKARACKDAARQCVLSNQPESAKERYIHFRGYEGQQANLLKAITALHTQRMTLDAQETNAIVLQTLKATTQQKFKHPLIDAAEVDRITDAIHACGDRVDEDTNQLQTIGSNSQIPDEVWAAFMNECTAGSNASADVGSLPSYNAEPPPAFPSVPETDFPAVKPTITTHGTSNTLNPLGAASSSAFL